VGVDVAGPATKYPDFSYKDHKEAFAMVRDAGLGITVHTGEDSSVDEMWDVMKYIQPDRIGHGIQAIHDPKMIQEIVDRDITLEICPTSNIQLGVVKDIKQL